MRLIATIAGLVFVTTTALAQQSPLTTPCREMAKTQLGAAKTAKRKMETAYDWRTQDKTLIDMIVGSAPFTNGQGEKLSDVMKKFGDWRRTNVAASRQYWIEAKAYFQAEANYRIAHSCAKQNYANKDAFEKHRERLERDLALAFGRMDDCIDASGADPAATSRRGDCVEGADQVDNDGGDVADGGMSIAEEEHLLLQQLKEMSDTQKISGTRLDIGQMTEQLGQVADRRRQYVSEKGILVWEKKYLDQMLNSGKLNANTAIP